MNNRIIVLLLLVMLAGCKKKNDKPVVEVSPRDFRLNAMPGDVKDYTVSVTSDVKLARFLIKVQPENSFEAIYKDTLLYTKNFSFKLQYLVPQAFAGKLITITFSAIDEDGNEGADVRQLLIGDQLLTSYSGLQFLTYSNPSNNAFDLDSLVPSSSSNDSSYRDLEEFTTDSTSLVPCYKWHSPAGGKFVKANNYDYGNATQLTAKNIYEGSIQFDITDSIVPGDIYITRLGSNANAIYRVIKITGIHDEPNTNADYYTFDVKK